jgi:beta-N-acetylhexosaminidase
VSPNPAALIAFEGKKVDPALATMLSDPRVAGVTLYGSLNIDDAEQTRRLTTDLRSTAGRPLLVATDQEGGQLNAAGPETTPFAGNLALGATGDRHLAFDVAKAIGTELAALGISVNYAPVADVATRPWNPSLGIRSFGEDPALVSEMTAAMVNGLQSAGVAATIKHFPGKGEATVDPHDELPVLELDLERLERVEFAPFRAGIASGSRLLMVGHYGLPAVTGDRRIPTSISAEVMEELIRGKLHFGGLIVTDALDMGAFGDAPTDLPLEMGADLLLYGPAQAGRLPDRNGGNPERMRDLHAWLAGFRQPDLSVVGCAAHQALAADLAERAITLVRDNTGLLPLSATRHRRILAVMPRPIDLTPADTSSLVAPGLARALRKQHPDVTEIVVDHEPSETEIAGVAEAARRQDVVVLGTIEAGEAQAALVKAVLATETPVVTVALRTPYDLARYPEASTYVCTYGIHPPSMAALAAALFGRIPMTGTLPAAVPGLYPPGHGLRREAVR